MRRNLYLGGEPDELKSSYPVLSGGKPGDNIKGLPIAISPGGMQVGIGDRREMLAADGHVFLNRPRSVGNFRRKR